MLTTTLSSFQIWRRYWIDNAVINTLRRKFERVLPELDERSRRYWAANEAIELGQGGMKAVAEATGYQAGPFVEVAKNSSKGILSRWVYGAGFSNLVGVANR
jgi:hypothetical protein